MNKISILIATVLLISSLVACSVPTASGNYVQSDKPRITSPVVENTDLTTLVDGNTVFTLDLYQELTGNAYVYLDLTTRKVPQELWIIPSQWIRPVPSRQGMVSHYEYGRGQDKVRFETTQIVHSSSRIPTT